jgi:3-isopropylmalate/(R)-2-methylmalate dehydratase small subunit
LTKNGLGKYLFDDWRYSDNGWLNKEEKNRKKIPDFVLNKKEFLNSSILISGNNFGCGSSREHAPWSLMDFGFKCIIAQSFADIFYQNCYKNGLLCIKLPKEIIEKILCQIENQNGYKISVDLESKSITLPDKSIIKFEIENSIRTRLLDGLDDIEISLEHSKEIKKFEEKYYQENSWLK